MRSSALISAAVLAALAASCGPGGTVAEPGERTERAPPPACTLVEAGCHDAAQCNGQGICEAAPPSTDPGCGIPPNHEEACKADSDCGSGEVCNSFQFACTVGHHCEARCDSAGCPDGSLCRADGRCSASQCPGEWSCAAYGACHPPAPGEGPLQGGRDWHGCVPQTCARDADCPCAHCVNSACSPIPGRCIQPRG